MPIEEPNKKSGVWLRVNYISLNLKNILWRFAPAKTEGTPVSLAP